MISANEYNDLVLSYREVELGSARAPRGGTAVHPWNEQGRGLEFGGVVPGKRAWTQRISTTPSGQGATNRQTLMLEPLTL